PGTYSVTATIMLPAGVTLRGAPGQPRPVLVADTGSPVVTADANGNTVRHLVIRQLGSTGPALHSASLLPATITLDDLVVEAPGDGGTAAQLGLGASLSNSVVRASNAATGTAIATASAGATLHNVT